MDTGGWPGLSLKQAGEAAWRRFHLSRDQRAGQEEGRGIQAEAGTASITWLEQRSRPGRTERREPPQGNSSP